MPVSNQIHEGYIAIGSAGCLLRKATHVLQRPGGVDQRLDLALGPQREHAVHGAAHVVGAPVLEQQVSQVQTGQTLVLVEQLDGRHLVHLPPLRIR